MLIKILFCAESFFEENHIPQIQLFNYLVENKFIDENEIKKTILPKNMIFTYPNFPEWKFECTDEQFIQIIKRFSSGTDGFDVKWDENMMEIDIDIGMVGEEL